MTGLEALVARGWLRAIAPLLIADPRAPRDALAADAVEILSPNYAGRAQLAGALANALRRAASTGVFNAAAQLPENVNAATAAGACVKAEAAFRGLVDGPLGEGVDLTQRVAELLNTLPALRGQGAAVASEVMEAFDHQVMEVLPREGPYGLKPAVSLLEAFIAQDHPADLTKLAHRDLGSALSLLGQPTRAREHFLKSGDAIRARLEAAEEAMGVNDTEAALARTDEALSMARAAGDGRYAGAALRRKAMLIGASGDVATAEALLFDAARTFQAASDGRGEAEALEALSHSAADQNLVDRAVTLLGAVRKLQRDRVFAAGEGRALRLAGRLLCENGRPVEGMVMLFQARVIAGASDPHVEHPLEHYISGFQETLNAEEFSRVEKALEGDWEMQINVAFAAARCRAPDTLSALSALSAPDAPDAS